MNDPQIENAADSVARIAGADAFCQFADAAGLALPQPFRALVRKERMRAQTALVLPLRMSPVAGRGVTFVAAQANKAAPMTTVRIVPLIPSSPYELIMGRGGHLPVGLGDWLPEHPPVQGDNFCGVDRTADITRLSGLRVVANGTSWEDAATMALTRVVREGGSPDYVVVSTTLYDRVPRALNGPEGIVHTIYDPGCDADTAFVIQLDTWCLYIADDGREALVCTNPGYNARLVGV